MPKSFLIALALLAGQAGSALAADFDPGAAHDKFINAFNHRQWNDLKPLLAQDIVFHRANAAEVYSGQAQVLDHFDKTIGGEWNVKFVTLDSSDQLTGKDGRVVERGDFAVTAGVNDDTCYAGSYMMTWAPQSGGDWQLQTLAWQDLETDLENCK
jgi:hypothetical protein